MKHGLAYSAENRIWRGMKMRCYNSKVRHYQRYGGAGITVCDRWRDSFENFYADMGPRPSPRHSIDRINPAGPYSPENCRWATRTEQAQNKVRAIFVEWNGERLHLKEAAKRAGVNYYTARQRIRRGCPVERALTPEHIENQVRGSRQGSARLKEDDVLRIKTWISEGVDRGFIAEKFGVARSTIDAIKTGQNWRHIG